MVILWGVLASHAGHFITSSAWTQLYSIRIKAVVIFLLFSATLSTCTALADFWRFGTGGEDSYAALVRVSWAQSFATTLVAVISITVQSVLVVRASKVGRLKWRGEPWR